jgi:hypothetical protein
LDGLTNLSKHEWWVQIVIQLSGYRDLTMIPNVKMARMLANCRLISILSDRERFVIFDYVDSLFKHLRFTDSSVK